MKISNLLLKLLSFSIVSTALQNGKVVLAETLKNALEKAYNVSETIEIKQKQSEFGKVDRDTAISNLLPSLQATYQYNFKKLYQNLEYEGAMAIMARSGNPNYEGSEIASVQATLPLSLWKTIPGVYGSFKGMNAKSYEYKDFLENFGLLFIQKYMDVIYNEKSLEVYKQMSEILEKKVKKVQVMKQYGSAKNDKVVLAEAQYYKNKADEIQTKSNLDKTKMDYKIMTGEEPTDLQIPDLTNAQLPAKTKDEFIQMVLSQNSKLLQTENEMKAQTINTAINGMNLLPDLFLSMSYAHYKIPDSMKIDAIYAGVGLSWTINGQGNTINKFRKEYKTHRIANLNYSLTLKQTEQDAGYAWEQYFAMLELVKATQKALKASTDSLKEVKVSVATGTATFIDEMDVENQYLEANLNYLNAQKALILSYYKMISMTGVGKLPVM